MKNTKYTYTTEEPKAPKTAEAVSSFQLLRTKKNFDLTSGHFLQTPANIFRASPPIVCMCSICLLLFKGKKKDFHSFLLTLKDTHKKPENFEKKKLK